MLTKKQVQEIQPAPFKPMMAYTRFKDGRIVPLTTPRFKREWSNEQTKSELIAFIKETLKGIDKDETECPDGWWETSTGADFGKSRLDKIILFIEEYGNKAEKTTLAEHPKTVLRQV